MKKILIAISAIIILLIIIFLYFFRSSSGFRSVNLVPDDAVLIVESKSPMKAWDDIIHSDAWEHLSSNPLLQKINSEIFYFDSILNDNKVLMKLAGDKPVLISQHSTGNHHYGLLYIVEAGRAGNYTNPEKLFRTVLDADEYEITTRGYKQGKIVEILDITEGQYYFITLMHGKLVFSFDTKLVEASIDASENMTLGRESKFLDVYSKLSNEGLVSLYINHRNLGPFINSFSPETRSDIFENKQLLYSGISFDITKEGLIRIDGYSSLNDSVEYSYREMFHNGSTEIQSAGVIPLRLASLVKVNFRNASDYFNSSMKLMGEKEYNNNMDELKKIEKRFRINFDKNFFSWMDKEVVLLQTKPSNLGRSNEFAAIIHANDSTDAADNLSFLWKQIKRHSPIKIKSVTYKEYNIDYVAFPGLLKLLFGKLLDKIETPYFSQIGEQVIISNHPQTIKNLIDDYLSRSTLNTSIAYDEFTNKLSSRSAIFAYFEPPVMFYNMKDVLSPKSWKTLQKNKDYFTCFSQAGAEIDLSDDLIHFEVKAQYKPEVEEWKREYYSTFDIISLFNNADLPESNNKPDHENNIDTIPKIIIHQLDAEKQTDYYDDGSVKREFELKKGVLHGDFKEYYQNGEVRIKGEFDKGQPSGRWKYYDEKGDLIKTDKY